MSLRPRSASALFFFLLPLPGCISNTLSIDIRTQINADGSCNRRVEYRLERTKRNDGASDPATGFRQAPDGDPLRRFFRLPSGPVWTVDETVDDDLHLASAQAFLPSANAIGSDYRMGGAKGQPATNHVSFGHDAEAARYEYLETFHDPNSPVILVSRIAEAAEKRDGVFAEALETALNGRIRRAEVRRVFRERHRPVVRALRELAGRPLFGPRERHDLEEVLKAMVIFEDGPLKAALLPLAPGVGEEGLSKAFERASEEAFGPVMKEIEEEGIPLLMAFGDDASGLEIRFRATLVLPVPIVRANTCFQGDTATWDFTQDDLYGRGFEMWVKASGR